MRSLGQFIVITFLFSCLYFGLGVSAGSAEDELAALSKQIMEAKCDAYLDKALNELSQMYFKDHGYNRYVDFLGSVIKQRKETCPILYYYAAFARYNQLKYLEEAQVWDEYFAQGDAYRDQVTQNLKKVIDATTPKEAIQIRALLLLWQFHRDQGDSSSEGALDNLLIAVKSYAPDAKDLGLIKEVADKLFSYGEKGKARELYRLYVDKIAGPQTKDEDLKNSALIFYNEANLDIAEDIYDIYIGRISKSLTKQKLITALAEIAKEFVYKDSGQKDPAYAEKLFAEIESVGGKAAFGESLMYLRAFNLEKEKEFSLAKGVYLDFIQRFPEARYANLATYKIGIIYTYVSRDQKQGSVYFAKLTESDNTGPEGIASLYQLGLLSQWAGDLVKASAYYNKILEKAQGNFTDAQNAAELRLKEIKEKKPIDYNLQEFLDASLKEGNAQFDMSRVTLSASPYTAKRGSPVSFTSNAQLGPSGCMQIEVQYLWSGDLGSISPSQTASAFTTTYKDLGAKVINLVVVSPTGILDRTLDFVDID